MTTCPTLPDRLGEDEKGIAVLYSGGMDSTVVLKDYMLKGYKVYPIAMDDGSLNYNLRRRVAIEESLKELGILNRLIEVRIPAPEPLRISKDKFGFIPGYKMMMLLAAMSYCQILNVSLLAVGYNLDNSDGGYLDEGAEFMDKLAALYYETYAIETNNDYYFGKYIKIVNEYDGKSKAEMTAYGHSIGVDFSTTISCRQIRAGAGLSHCGKCEVCRRRAVAFRDAGVPDPTIWVHVPQDLDTPLT